MKKITFDEEELFAIAVFEPSGRTGAVAAMEDVLPELEEDEDVHALVVSAKEKLKRISDEDFTQLPIAEYIAEFAQERDIEETTKSGEGNSPDDQDSPDPESNAPGSHSEGRTQVK